MDDFAYEQAVVLRHWLHAYPEVSFCEQRTMARLMEFIGEHTRGEIVSRGSWFYVLFRSQAALSRPAIAFRADMDALPMTETLDLPWRSLNEGAAHKCGHDGHSAALAGFAIELDGMTLDRDVYLIFQHAEEVGGGGAECAALLEEAGIERVYAFHNWQGFPLGSVVVRPGTSQCASMGVRFAFTGRQSHASMPEMGVNPARALAEITSYATNVGNFGDNLCMATVVGVHLGNDDFGISPAQGHICLTLRAELQKDLDDLFARLSSMAQELAEAEGLTLEIHTQDVFPATSNNPQAVEKVLAAAKSLGIPTIELEMPLRASEDFGYYLQRCKGAMFYIGNGEEYPALHTDGYDFIDSNIRVAVDMFLRLLA